MLRILVTTPIVKYNNFPLIIKMKKMMLIIIMMIRNNVYEQKL